MSDDALPPLPDPTPFLRDDVYTADQMRAYARAALAARAGQEPDDDRPTWGVPHAGTIRCLRAAEDRIRAGEPPDDVFADYGWSMNAAPPALPPEARDAMRMALDALVQWDALIAHQYTGSRAAMDAMHRAFKPGLRAADALRAALGDGGAAD